LKFHVTAITHRADRPIFYSPLAYGFETDNAGAPFREACFYELADRIRPGLVTDVNIIPGAAGWAGNIIFQVQKKRRADEGQQRNILAGALSAAQGLRLAIAVDEDVDIYSVDDILWSITTRLDPATGIIKGTAGGMGQALMPMERVGTSPERSAQIRFEGGLAFDATVPFEAKWNFERAQHPVSQIDLRKWFSEQQLRAIEAQQSEYARLLSRRG
jgi:4-hydroxy-3-polyprenylbenzoate decarboxylase